MNGWGGICTYHDSCDKDHAGKGNQEYHGGLARICCRLLALLLVVLLLELLPVLTRVEGLDELLDLELTS